MKKSKKIKIVCIIEYALAATIILVGILCFANQLPGIFATLGYFSSKIITTIFTSNI